MLVVAVLEAAKRGAGRAVPAAEAPLGAAGADDPPPPAASVCIVVPPVAVAAPTGGDHGSDHGSSSDDSDVEDADELPTAVAD